MLRKIGPIRNFRQGFTLKIYDQSPEIQKFYFEELRDVLFILEVLLQKIRAMENSDRFFPKLLNDLRRNLVYCNILLDIQGHPVQIIPIEQPLFRKEVLDRLLPGL